MNHKKEQIEKYKALYGKVYKYTTSDGKSCLLRSPDLKIIDACRAVSGGSSVKFDIALVANCWLEGDKELDCSHLSGKKITSADKEVFADDAYRMGLFDWLGGIIRKVDGQLEEL